MKLKKECIQCKTEIFFGKKDIKPVPKWKLKEMNDRNEAIHSMLKRKKKNIFGREVDYYSPLAYIQLFSELREAYGVIECPACKTKQLITNK